VNDAAAARHLPCDDQASGAMEMEIRMAASRADEGAAFRTRKFDHDRW
jgi:hypothetical protein